MIVKIFGKQYQIFFFRIVCNLKHLLKISDKPHNFDDNQKCKTCGLQAFPIRKKYE